MQACCSTLTPHQCDQSQPRCGSCTKKSKTCVYGVLGAPFTHSSSPFGVAPSVASSENAQQQYDGSRLLSVPASSCSSPRSVQASSEPTYSQHYCALRAHERPPHHSASPSLSSTPIDRQSNVLWEDLGLLHHFTMSTAKTLSATQHMYEAWQVGIPKSAVDRPFLMHAMLACAALHCVFLEPAAKDKYIASAIRHRDLCLPLYRSHLSTVHELKDLSPESSTAIFACSTFIALYSLAFPVCAGPADHLSQDPISDFVECFSLLEGSTVLLRQTFERLKDGHLGSKLSNRFPEMPNGIRNYSDVAASEHLRPLIAHIDGLSPGSDKSAYLDALSALSDTLKVMHSPNADNGIVLAWPFLFDDQGHYVKLLAEGREPALLILAYYGVALDTRNDEWWLQSCGRRLVLEIDRRIGHNATCKALLEWPLQMVLHQNELRKGVSVFMDHTLRNENAQVPLNGP